METEYSHQSISPQQYCQNKFNGLRRINVQKLDNYKELESDLSQSYEPISSSNTLKSLKQNIDNQKIQIFSICDVIQTQVCLVHKF